MANKFLDENGLLYFWQKIINKFVAKETGKGLSTNDYTTEEKTKLSGIAEGANKTTVTDSLTSTSTTDALSANQGKVLDEKIAAINTNMGNLGGGDMMKSAYDTDSNGKVDNADNADKFGGQAPEYYATAEEVGKKANDADLATVAKTGSYNDLINKPTDFAPSTHSHEMTDVTGLEDALGNKAEKTHNHTTSEITDFSTEMAKKADVSHTHEQSEINGLANVINEVTAIAEGKCKSYTFETVEELDTALTEYVAFITDGTAMSETNQLNGKTLGNGDVFLIRATDVPDYWWDESTSSKQILETTKVELNVISNSEIDTIVATS